MMNIYNAEAVVVAAIAAASLSLSARNRELGTENWELFEQTNEKWISCLCLCLAYAECLSAHTATLTNTIRADKARAWINITYTLRCATLCKCQRQVFTPRRSTIKCYTNVWKMHNTHKHVWGALISIFFHLSYIVWVAMCCKMASIATMQQWQQVPSAPERTAAE